MRLLEFDKSVSLTSVIDTIKSVPEKSVILRLSPDTPWLGNPVNKKILRKAAQGFGKSAQFEGEETPATPAGSSQSVVLNSTPEPQTSAEAQDYQEENEDPDDTGFIVGADVAESPLPSATPPQAPLFQPRAEPEVDKPFNTPMASYVKKSGFSGRIGQLGHFLVSHWILSLIGAAVIVILLLVYIVVFLPKADVKIIIAERPLESSATVTASTKITSADTKTHTIPALTKTSEQSGTQDAQTTGNKVVGTKAQGSVTLYNNTDFNKSLTAGSSLTASSSSGSLKFTIAQAVTLPKRNSLTGVPSGTDVSVNAADIGDKYNVPQNTAFALDQDSVDVKGTNAQAASGGTSKSVQVVAQADLDKLTSDLTKTLTDKAKQDVLTKVGQDYQAVDQGIKTSVTNKSFDHSVGDQAATVTLSLTISATATIYKSQDLKDMLINSLENNLPNGFEVDQSAVTTSADLAQVADNGDLIFAGHIKGDLIPKFDQGKLASDLAGKTPSAADGVIKVIPQLVSYNISFWPNLPAPFKAFPRDPHRIHITVSVNKYSLSRI
jgi:hypothetical protein